MGIYVIPEDFQTQLDKTFDNKLRVRWSDKLGEWQIEQKVRRGLAVDPLKPDPYNDDQIRHKDGYVWVMSVKQGSKFPCPQCGLDLSAPTRQTEMVSCQHCRAKGYNHHWVASHWPLDQTLIDHLQKMEREIDDKAVRLRKARTILQRQQERMVLDPTLAEFEDSFNRIAGIPSVGYTGKVFTG